MLTTDAYGNVSPSSVSGLTYLDSTWRLSDNLDPTKQLALQLAGLTTGTTRTLTVPDASGTIALIDLAQTWSESQAFGGNALSFDNGAGSTGFINNSGIQLARTGFYRSNYLVGGTEFYDDGAGIFPQVQWLRNSTSGWGRLGPGAALTGTRDWTLPDATGTLALTSALASYQPLDTDLTEIAAVANVRGDILITDSGPTWVRKAIGAAGTYLGSDGTDPAWTALDAARTWATLQKFKDTTFLIGDDGDITKAFQWSLSGATTGKTVTLASAHTDDRTVTLPDATTVLAGLAVGQTFDGANVFDLQTALYLGFLQDTAANSGQLFKVNDTVTGFEYNIGLSGTISADVTLVLPVTGGTVPTTSSTNTLTNKRVTPRVVSMTNATSFTPTGDTADINTQANTQALGTLTANAPSGTPTNGQQLLLRIKSTNVQTFAWNGIYRGGTTVPLPTATSGGTLTDYFTFRYESTAARWDCVAAVYGY